MRAIIYIVILFFVCRITQAQLVVSTNGSASALVQEIVGDNVVITNSSINCNGAGTGIFYSNGSNIGLNQGILLSTGKVTNAIGPNNSTGGGANTMNDCFIESESFFDSQLLAIEPEAKYDGCILEFDIQPYCNTLQIKYVFGSEEYPEFVNSGYNDAFGFFIWGTNPLGGTYNGYNIARLPSGTPVAIDNVNNTTNSSYFVNNTGGSSIEYDGFTTPLTAAVSVNPCNTYHLKLVIADAGDCIYDSGVFLEYKGISCSNNEIPTITTNTTASICELNNGTASVSVGNYSGNLSYQWSPGGQTSSTINNLAPGNYVCTISFQNPCPYTKTVSINVPHVTGFSVTSSITNIKCPQDVNGSATVVASGGNGPYTYNWSTTPTQTLPTANGLGMNTYTCTITDATGCIKKETITIEATTTLTLSPTSTEAVCNNPTGTASSNGSGGVPPYTYSWNTTPIQTGATATNLLPGIYSVSITDGDGCVKTQSITVANFVPDIVLTDSIINTTCNQPNGSIYINSVSGGTAPYSYNWSTSATASFVQNLATGVYTVNITDANNCPKTEVFTLINANFIPTRIVKKDDKCEQGTGSASIIMVGGSPPFSYTWSNGATTDSTTNLTKGTYWIDVTDAAGCTSTDTIIIKNINDVFNGYVTINPDEPEVNQPFNVTLYPTSVWNLTSAVVSDGRITTDTINSFNYQDYGWYSINYYIVSDDGCKDTVTTTFFVKDFMTIYVPNTFTPNSDGQNDVLYAYGTLVREFKLYIFNRWGELIFTSNLLRQGWDGTYKNEKSPMDTYVYKIQATDYYGKEHKFVGHINLIR